MKIVRRVLFLLLILALAALVLGQGKLSNLRTLGSVKDEVTSSGFPADFPILKAMGEIPSDWDGYHRDNNNIHIALEVTSQSEEQIAQDILDIFYWGRSQFGHISPDDYTEENWGTISIALIKMENMDSSGKIQAPKVVYYFWLDQDRIDLLLNGEDINSLDYLGNFFAQIGKKYEGRAGVALSLNSEGLYFKSWQELIYKLRSLGAVVP